MVIKGLFLNLVLLGVPSYLIKQLDHAPVPTGIDQVLLTSASNNYLEMALLAIPLSSESIDGLKALKSLHGEHEAECDCEESDCHKCHKHKGHRKSK